MDKDERGVRWPAREEARVRVGPVIACARDEARLGWSPGGGGAAGSDRSGGEERERHGRDREEENAEGRGL